MRWSSIIGISRSQKFFISASFNIRRFLFLNIHPVSPSCNIRRFCFEKIQMLSSSCNI